MRGVGENTSMGTNQRYLMTERVYETRGIKAPPGARGKGREKDGT